MSDPTSLRGDRGAPAAQHERDRKYIHPTPMASTAAAAAKRERPRKLEAMLAVST